MDNFSNKDFIVRDFVDSLAESAVPINRRSGPAPAAFDPKPLIRAFESTNLTALNANRQQPWLTIAFSFRCLVAASFARG